MDKNKKRHIRTSRRKDNSSLIRNFLFKIKIGNIPILIEKQDFIKAFFR